MDTWTQILDYFGKNHVWDFVFLAILGVIALAIKLMDWFGGRPRRRGKGQIKGIELVKSELLADAAGIAADAHGNLYVAGGEKNVVYKVTAEGKVSIHAGDGEEDSADGPATEARFDGPEDVALDGAGNLYVAEGGSDRIRAIGIDGRVTTLAGGDDGFADGPGATAQFDGACGVAVDESGNVFVADWGNDRIRKISPDGIVSTLAGNGDEGFADGVGGATGPAAFNAPSAVAVDGQGNVYVADSENNRIRRIDRDGVVSTFAGSGKRKTRDGLGVRASFYYPTDVVCRPSGGLLVLEAGCAGIRRVDPDGRVTTLTFSGAEADSMPEGIACTPDGGAVVSDAMNQRILRVSRADLDAKPGSPNG